MSSTSTSSTVKLKNENIHKAPEEGVPSKKPKFNADEKQKTTKPKKHEENLIAKEIFKEEANLHEHMEISSSLAIKQHHQMDDLISSASTALPIVNGTCNNNNMSVTGNNILF